MVRLTEDEKPMSRGKELSRDPVRTAGILCRDKEFHNFLFEAGQIFQIDEATATEWLKEELGVASRAEIPNSNIAIQRLKSIQQEFIAWKQLNG